MCALCRKTDFMGLAKGVQNGFISICQGEEVKSLVGGKLEKFVSASSISPLPFSFLSFPLAPIFLLPGIRKGDDFFGTG